MTGFEVSLNGRRLCLAGSANGVVTVVVTAADSRGERSLAVGGLSDGAHSDWVDDTELQPGDELRIRVVHADLADEPRQTRRDDGAMIENAERREYERLKKKYG